MEEGRRTPRQSRAGDIAFLEAQSGLWALGSAFFILVGNLARITNMNVLCPEPRLLELHLRIFSSIRYSNAQLNAAQTR
jgi:hypothetical protein